MYDDAVHIVLTGAAGYLASWLVPEVLRAPAFAGARLTLVDLAVPHPPSDPRVRVVAGDLGNEAVREAAIDGGVDVVFHLAGILGGAAEADPALARRVNLDATLALWDDLRAVGAGGRVPRVVYASSIAVFGPPLPDPAGDDSPTFPTLVYGAQKRQVEIALEQYSARGWLDGIALRVPGIVARNGADARQRSAFLNRLFFAHARGDDLDLPVSADGTTWLLSARRAAESFVAAALLPPESLGRQRAILLPAQRVRIDALVAALAARHPSSPSRIRYVPDADIEAQFARYPELRTPLADALGFTHDGDLDALIDNALALPG